MKMQTGGNQAPLLILGGGVIGLSIALHVRELDPRVPITVVDAPTQAGVASRAAAGMLAPYAEFHEASPLFGLCRVSLDYYPEFLQKFCPDGPLLDPLGVLVPASGDRRSRAEHIATFASIYTELAWLDEAALRREEPKLLGGRCREALRVPGAVINPRALHESLRTAARQMRIALIDQHATKVERRTSGYRLKLADGESLEAARLVVATGAWSENLGSQLGLSLPMVPVKGQVARLEAPDGFLNHVIHEHEVYLAPRRGQGIVIGATVEVNNFDASVKADTIEALHAAAAELVPEARALPIAESWSGFRPKLPSGNPVLGRAPGQENLFLATGHFRNGILLTPITGRMVAELICDLGEEVEEFSANLLTSA